MYWVLGYLALVAVATVVMVAATSDRYRHHFPWLIMDDPEDTWNGH
jgi:hypothetical protein